MFSWNVFWESKAGRERTEWLCTVFAMCTEERSLCLERQANSVPCTVPKQWRVTHFGESKKTHAACVSAAASRINS